MLKNGLKKRKRINSSAGRYKKRIVPGIEKRFTEIGYIFELVVDYFNGDVKKTSLWFQTPTPLLGNISPNDMILYGRHRKLLQFVTNLLNGNS